LVWFGFISLKPKKPNPNRKKQSQNKKTKANRFETGFYPKNRTETGQFEPVSVFFNFFLVWLLFFIKTEPNRIEPKMITLTRKKQKKCFLLSIIV
jgi:hypothetical protein